MGLDFGSDMYRAGAFERLEDSRILMEKERLAGSIYMAGRAVEGMLRGLIWLKTHQLETGHDLKKMAEMIGRLGLLQNDKRDDDFVVSISSVAQLWHNNLRYAGEKQIWRFWLELNAVDRKGKRTLKRACRDFYENSAKSIERCDRLWQH